MTSPFYARGPRGPGVTSTASNPSGTPEGGVASLHVNTSTLDLFRWSGSAWVLQGNLKGPDGDPGDAGPEGRHIVGVSIDGDDIVLEMSEGEDRRASVPAIVAANTAASAASGSASSAAGHASAASTQAGLAEGYSLAAGGFRDEAQTFRDQAEGFRNAADGFATAASTSAASAEGFSEVAGGFADDAEGFRDEASDHATTALGHSNSASGYAATAQGHATTATNQAALAGVARSGAEAAEENAEGFRDEAEGFRDEAEGFKNAAAQSAEDAASVVLDGVPNASASVKGGILLTGDLSGTWDSPTVPGLSAKVDAAYVAAQIAALVDSAPGVLDTLQEIAAALGNDQNFASTMSAALANKANLTDPRFTDARTPTAHQHNASDIPSITSAMITDGTIVDADVSASAGIVGTKLAAGVQASLGKADSAVQPASAGSVVVGSLPGSGVAGVLYVVP